MVVPFLAVALGCAMGVSPAHADIYTWTDPNGRVNISNVAPPEGARVTSVLHEAPKPERPQQPVDTAPQPDVRALTDRVMQLEWELDQARRQPPPTAVYAAAPPQPQYPPQPVPQYSYPEPAPSYGSYGSYGCDPSGLGCGLAWSPWGYPASIVVVRSPGFHRPPFHGMHRPVYPQPVRPHPGGPPGRPSAGGMNRR